MEVIKFIVVCLLTLTFTLSSASDQNETNVENLEESYLPEELKSDSTKEVKQIENLETGETISETNANSLDPVNLNPEDEDMEILKIEKLGGILDAKDIAEIVEEQASEDKEGDIPEEELKFEPIPMPTNFESYDINDDRFIDVDELKEVTQAYENIEQVFRICDTNGDGLLDREEFRLAPLDLAGKPPELAIESL